MMPTDVTGRPSFTCPWCGTVTHNRTDIQQGYCGRCHWWTGDPVLSKVEPVPALAELVRGEDPPPARPAPAVDDAVRHALTRRPGRKIENLPDVSHARESER